MADEHAYAPSRLDQIVRNWPALASLAEGCASSLPDAHRRSKGKRVDPYQHADRLADLERALAAVLPPSSLERRTVLAVRQGFPLRDLGTLLRVREQHALRAYRLALHQLGRYLGWEPGEPDDASVHPYDRAVV